MEILGAEDLSRDTSDFSFASVSKVFVRVDHLRKIEKWRKNEARRLEGKKAKSGKGKKLAAMAAAYAFTIAAEAAGVAVASGPEEENSELVIPLVGDGLDYSYSSNPLKLDSLGFFIEHSSETKQSLYQRYGIRVRFDFGDRQDEGLLLAHKRKNEVFFYSDKAITPEARALNELRHEERKARELHLKISESLKSDSGIVTHLFGPMQQLYVLAISEDASTPENREDHWSTKRLLNHIYISNCSDLSEIRISLGQTIDIEDIQVVDTLSLVEAIAADPIYFEGFLPWNFEDHDLSFMNDRYVELFDANDGYADKSTDKFHFFGEDLWIDQSNRLFDLVKKQAATGGLAFWDEPYNSGSARGFAIGSPDDNYYTSYSFIQGEESVYTVRRASESQVVDMRFDDAPHLFFKIADRDDVIVHLDMEQFLVWTAAMGSFGMNNLLANRAELQRQEEEKRLREARVAEWEKKLEGWRVKYGQEVMDAYERLDVIPGMPEEMAVAILSGFGLSVESSYESSYSTTVRFSGWGQTTVVTISKKDKVVTNVSVY